MFHPTKPEKTYRHSIAPWTDTNSPKSPIASSLSLHWQYPGCNIHSLEKDLDLDQQLEDLYSSDEFRMYHFKVHRCTLTQLRHDWTNCPYLHTGEKVRRRDPMKFFYSSELCTEFRKSGKCANRDNCKFAHGVFEVWLHPDRYRTQLCRDGMACKRKVCFFAHSFGQLRMLGDIDSDATESDMSSVTVAPTNSTNLPMLSSLLNAIIADMRRTRVSMINNAIFCGIDMFHDGGIEVPDFKWVSDLVDF